MGSRLVYDRDGVKGLSGTIWCCVALAGLLIAPILHPSHSLGRPLSMNITDSKGVRTTRQWRQCTGSRTAVALERGTIA